MPNIYTRRYGPVCTIKMLTIITLHFSVASSLYPVASFHRSPLQLHRISAFCRVLYTLYHHGSYKFRRMFCSIFGKMGEKKIRKNRFAHTVDDFCSPNTPHSQHICRLGSNDRQTKLYTRPILHLHGVESINL